MGGYSKIVPTLKDAAGVVTTRAVVNYVVTEYGVTNLWGLTMPQRARELIRLAHPDDREALDKAAFERFGSAFKTMSSRNCLRFRTEKEKAMGTGYENKGMSSSANT